ncbi:MAG TPA: hypothetical protein VJZ00_18070 [Thermoanaerobaculia bacterium]|nr:hypothetical protein [Thermoanaerobaculia bacterium]
MQEDRKGFPRSVAIAAIAIGLIGGSYGIATAASGNGSNDATTPSTAPDRAQPWGHQRSDETLLTDGTATSVRNAALAKVPGATIVRVETDADGNAPYEAHLIKSDGTPATVYVDKSFNVVSVETR